MVEGKNIVLRGREQEKLGFFTTRWVEASNQQEAERLAIDFVNEELASLSAVGNPKDDPPKLVVEKIRKVDSFGDVPVPGKGFSFYRDDRPSEA
jgi:hypothetical protein